MPLYILRETARIFLIALLAVTGVVFIAYSVRLLNEGLNVIHLGQGALYIVLYALPFALPSALLISCVLSFGRFVQDNELLAARAHGINTTHLIAPVLAFALLLSVSALILNNYALPAAHRHLRRVGNDAIEAVLRRLGSYTPELELGGYRVWVGQRDPKRLNAWDRVAVAKFTDADMLAELYIARRGSYALDDKSQRAAIVLDEVYLWRPTAEYDVNANWSSRSESLQLDIDLTEDSEEERIAAADLDWKDLMKRYRRMRKNISGQELIPAPREVRNQLESQMRKLEDKLNRQLEAVKGLHFQRDDASRRLAAMQTRIERLAETQSQIEESHSAKVVEEGALRHEIQELEQRLAREAISDRADEIRARITDLGRRAAAIGRERQALTMQLAAIKADLQTANAAKAEAADDLARLNAQIETDEAQLREDNPAFAEMEKQLNIARDQAAFLDCATMIHVRLSQSAAAFIFALIGIPLGIIIQRGSAVVAFGVSLAVILALYYPLYVVGRMLAAGSHLPPGIALWLSPAACLLIGLVFFRMARRR